MLKNQNFYLYQVPRKIQTITWDVFIELPKYNKKENELETHFDKCC